MNPHTREFPGGPSNKGYKRKLCISKVEYVTLFYTHECTNLICIMNTSTFFFKLIERMLIFQAHCYLT